MTPMAGATSRVDCLGRTLRPLVTMLEDLNHVGVEFVSLGEGIDCTTAAGKLQLHILAALADFGRAQGRRLGRPKSHPATVDVPGGSVRAATKAGECRKAQRRVGSRQEGRQTHFKADAYLPRPAVGDAIATRSHTSVAESTPATSDVPIRKVRRFLPSKVKKRFRSMPTRFGLASMSTW